MLAFGHIGNYMVMKEIKLQMWIHVIEDGNQ